MISDKTLVSDKGNACEGLDAALSIVQRTAEYYHFSQEDVQLLRHLAGEMVSGSAAILDIFSGTMWVETDETMFKIQLEMEGLFNQDERDRLIELTRDNKNTLPKGFFAKLGVLLGDALTGEYAYPTGLAPDVDNAELMWNATQITEMVNAMNHRNPEDETLIKEAKGELDSLADDVSVSASSSRVLVTVSKRLPKQG